MDWALRPTIKTFKSDAVDKGLPPGVVLLVPDFPLDFRLLNSLDQRYVIAFAQGRWSPDKDWVRNSSWESAFNPKWDKMVSTLEQKMELWISLASRDPGAWRPPALAALYRDIVVQ